MLARAVIVLLWLVTLVALAGAFSLPGSAFHLYFHDWYVVVAKRSLIVLIFVALVIPLLMLTIRRFHATHQP